MPQEKDLEKWMKKADSIFTTLIIPVAFLITLTSTFLFEYFGRTLPAEDFSRFLKTQVPVSTANISIFIFSIIVWSLTIFLRRGKRKTNLKYISLGLLWMSLLIVPFPLMFFTLTQALGTAIAFYVYGVFFVVVFALLLKVSKPPIKTLPPRRKCKWGIKGRYSRLCPICWFCKRKRKCKSV